MNGERILLDSVILVDRRTRSGHPASPAAAPRQLLVWLLPLLLAVLAGPRIARAQTADPQLEIWVHSSIVGIRTAATAHPVVRLLDPAGRLRAQVEQGGAHTESHWQIDLSAGRPVEQRILIEPGDTVEVRIGAESTRLEAPAMAVTADTVAETVSGIAPAGSLAVFVALHRDLTVLDGPADVAPQSTPAGAGGRFSIDFRGLADISSGYWGEAAVINRAGHIFIYPFAPPQVTLSTAENYALIRTDPVVGDLRLISRDALGSDRFASGPAYPLSGSLYAVPLLPGGLPENGVYRPGTGETLLLSGPAGEREVGAVPRILASLDSAGSRVWGHADAGARLSIALDRDGDGQDDAAAVTKGDAQGRFSQTFSPPPTLGSRAKVLAWTGSGVARLVGVAQPELVVRLYGHVLTGSIAGWGKVLVEHVLPGGERQAWTEVETDPAGFLVAELRSSRGQDSAFQPGDRLRLKPEIGAPVDLVVPLVSAMVDAPGGKTLVGQAPIGARLESAVYYKAADFFGPQPYQEDYQVLAGRAESSGSYTLRCGAEPCAMYYGILSVHDAGAAWVLEWVDQPIVGIGVSDLTSLGRATAGQPIVISPLDATGQPKVALRDLVRPQINGQLPQWLISLDQVFPQGIQPGDRFRLEVGARVYDFTVPDLRFTADNRTDTVTGKAPPLKVLVAAGFARGDLQGRAAAGNAATLSGLTGDFATGLGGFDLRSGDDVEVYLFEQTDRFMWWSQRGIAALGPEPTRPVPTASATPSPTIRPSAVPVTPSPTAVGGWRLLLPRLQR